LFASLILVDSLFWSLRFCSLILFSSLFLFASLILVASLLFSYSVLFSILVASFLFSYLLRFFASLHLASLLSSYALGHAAAEQIIRQRLASSYPNMPSNLVVSGTRVVLDRQQVQTVARRIGFQHICSSEHLVH
jgi:hypothetical protein